MAGPRKAQSTSGSGRGAGPSSGARSARPAAARGAGPKGAGPKGAGPKGAGPKGAGPYKAGPKAAGPKGAGPKGAGAYKAAGPKAAGPHQATAKTGPKGSAPRSSGPKGRGPARSSGRGQFGSGRAPERGLDGTQVEGRHAVRELLLAGTRRVREVLIAEQMDQADILDDIVELAQDLKVPVREISKRRLDAESRTEASQGVVAHADPLPEHSLEDLARPRPTTGAGVGAGSGAGAGGAPFLVAVDGVTDPGNLGAIIRTAECAGVSGILLPRHRAVHVTPTVTKTAAGAVEHVPMALVGGLPAAIEEMKAHGVWVIGLDAGGEKSLHEVELSDEPVCLVLGAEGEGLSRLVRQRCDQIVSIPLIGSLSSLNVSTAAALAMYEVVRRRAAR